MSNPTPIVFTRADFAAFLSAAGYGSKAQAREILDTLLDRIRAVLIQGDVIALNEFGRLVVVAIPERPGRNPKTGEPHTIPAGRRVMFRPSKHLLQESAP